jgi:hypothetical protein
MITGDTKEAGILAAWIAGPLLIGGLFWFLSQPLRTRLLRENVNDLLTEKIEKIEKNALGPAVPASSLPKMRFPLGTWYTLRDSEKRVLVFPLMSGGSALPCAALVSPAGTVEEIISLRGERALRQVPHGVRAAYIRRIESDAQSFSASFAPGEPP